MSKEITTYDLQKHLSSALKEVENGEVFRVLRYSKEVAVVLSKKKYQEILDGKECRSCIQDLRKISKRLK